MAGLSKLAPVRISCVDYVHPWQPNCTMAHAGLIVEAALYSARTYTAVYVVSLLMRGRRPTGREVLRTALGIVRSTAFLTTNSFTFCMFLCIIRKYAGSFNFYTFSFVPSLLGSLCAILIERPSRRGMLALYTSNVASEAVFNMAVERGIVRPLRGGNVAVFAAGAAVLMYVYRQSGRAAAAVGDGAAANSKADSIFDVLRFVVGNEERAISRSPALLLADDSTSSAYTSTTSTVTSSTPSSSSSSTSSSSSSSSSTTTRHQRRPARNVPLAVVQRAVAAYGHLLEHVRQRCVPRHRTCPHRDSCGLYALQRASRLFGVGLAIQVALKSVLQAANVWRRGPAHLRRVLWTPDTMRLGVFLGGFAGLYRATSCALRHITDADRPAHAVPAALCASAAFAAYPDTTVALYAAWKAAQVAYDAAEARGWLPHVPHFDIVLYCVSTAMLFHVGIMEPLTLRPSYFKFLHSLSGARLVGMNRDCVECYGLDTVNKLAEAMRRTNIVQRPSFVL